MTQISYTRLGTILYSKDDIDRLKSIVGRKLTVIDGAVSSCLAVDEATRASWGQLYIEIRDWIASTPIADITFSFRPDGIRGEGYSSQLDTWQAKLMATPFSCYVPLFEPPPLKDPLDSLAATVKVIAGALVVGVSAYGVYEAIQWIDVLRPSRR